MQIKDLISLSLDYYDNNNDNLIKFFDKYYNDENKFEIERSNNQLFINIYKSKKKIAYCKINKLFDFINKYNTLYWEWSNINSDNYNIDVKKIWEYGFNLINFNKGENDNYNKFTKIIFLNSGLIINNYATLILVISLVSYILKKKIICFKYNESKNNFKLIYKEMNKNKINDNVYLYSYYYSINDFYEIKNNKFVKFQ